MGTLVVLLAATLALPAGASAPGSDSEPEARLGRVELQGESTLARERKTLAQLFKAEALFAKHHALAPAAALRFKVYARTQADRAPAMQLDLVTAGGRQPVVLDAEDRFDVDPAWRALDEGTEIRSRLADGRVTWRPDIRSPGVPAGERRLGDLRLQCRVGFESGVARGLSPLSRLLALALPRDGCTTRGRSVSSFADAPIFAVTLVHGSQRLTLSALNLHGLRDRYGERYDWGYSLRERMFRLPMGDERWPDDTRVVFETMDDPPTPPEPALSALQDDWVRAALALEPGVAPAEVAQRLGPASDDTVFESGPRLQRHVHDVVTPQGRLPVEVVSVFGADGGLRKAQLRRAE